MTELSRILCAVDFSAPARAAFRRALVLSRAHGAQLTVVHAVPKTRPFGLRARERIAALEELKRAAAAQGVRVRVRIQHGDPAGVIVLHARARPVDLVVLGTHQRHGLLRLREGSVAERVARRVESPTLIVPAGAGGGTNADGPFRSLVCATDFSGAAAAAMAQANALATQWDARLMLVHVSETVSPRYPYHFLVPEYARLVAQEAWARLQEAIPLADRQSRSVRSRVVSGRPAAEICRIARDVDADLIVLGLTDRNAVARRLVRSTTNRVMRKAPCAVLTVPELTTAVATATRAESLYRKAA